MVYARKHLKRSVNYKKAVTPLIINGETIKFTDVAEHVGVIRSPLLTAGLSRNQNTNPATSLRMQATYANPVLLSGVAPLILLFFMMMNSSICRICRCAHKAALF